MNKIFEKKIVSESCIFQDLIGGSTVTVLTFVFPPFFYLKLVDGTATDSTEQLVDSFSQRCS